MNIKGLIENSSLNIDKKKILYNEPMKKYTTFKVGGPAECLIKIDNETDLKEILNFANENNIEIHVVGNGSNLLVLDGGIKGIVLLMRIENIKILEEKNSEKTKEIEDIIRRTDQKEKVLRANKYIIEVKSGTKIPKLGQILMNKEISGFEELSGIPGTIGGAVIMNAGAHGKEMKDIVKSVKCLDYSGKVKEFTKEDMKFEYRNSILKNNKYIVTSVIIELYKGNKEGIQEKMKIYKDYRKEHQPIEYPSAGSTFKRGEDYITAKLIDEAGLKGYNIGDAEVSIKHAGFIINKGNATADDILNLIEHVKKVIYEKFEKKLNLEIQVIGEK
mgnify:CR=1 FL=1